LLSPNYIPEQFLSETGRRSSHNTFMAALVDQGFPGAILLLGIYLWAGRALVRLKRLDEQGLPLIFGIYRAAIGTALMSCLISGLFLNLLKTEVQIWLVALLASLIAISHSAVQEANNASDTEHPDARGMDEAGEARPPRSPPD
jgi:O-antigen ligase